MNRSESKYFCTAPLMDQAFLELLEQKDFAYITVKEICEKAGVNRSTFYLHYETITDLLEESAQYIIKQFTDFMPYDTVDFLEKIQNCSLEELYLMTPEYLTPYLNYVKKYRRVFQTTLEKASVLQMEDAYLALNRHVFTPILNRFHVPAEDQSYVMSFFINGLIAMINEWLRNDCKDSVEHLIHLMQICVRK